MLTGQTMVTKPASPAVDRALALLQLLSERPDGMGVSELSQLLAEAKSSLHAVLHTMVARGFVVKDPVTKAYQLGPQVLIVGAAYARQASLVREFQRVAADLAVRCGETVQLALLQGHEIVYIARQAGPQRVQLAAEIGNRLPAHATALGKALLSGLTDEELDQLYTGVALVPLTPATITQLDDLKMEVAAVRAQGYALDHGETSSDLRCCGAPIYGANNTVVAALSMSVPITRLDAGREAVLAQEVHMAGLEISRRLGYVVPTAATR